MSRLAEAETRFADAIKALEAAVESRLAAPSDASSGASSGAAVERAALRAELARIDEQVGYAMQMIIDAQRVETESVSHGEEGRA